MHFHAGKCQLMQGIFQKENTDKALKYGIYRHLPTYEKIIRNLVSFYKIYIYFIGRRILTPYNIFCFIKSTVTIKFINYFIIGFKQISHI
ncbi:hypothetical protein DWY32_10245 [Agathobacter rectalis]|nr:hypothetical protein DWY32_10245 [Agathobacter rectalis]